MYAMKVMTRPVVTIPADTTVFQAADILLGSRISGAPVVDDGGKLVGIVSEADLMNRPELGTVPARSWLQRLLTDEAVLAKEYARSHSHRVADVMTREVVTADERTELKQIALLMTKHRIRRVPIVRDGRVVGIVSRADLLQGLLSREPRATDGSTDDDTLRSRVVAELGRHSWGTRITNLVVDNGTVNLWGHVGSSAAREAVRIAVENVPGVKRVTNNVVVMTLQLPS